MNTKGDMDIRGMVGEKIRLVTGSGLIVASGMVGFDILVQAKEDGGLIDVSRVLLESGDKNCREGVVYKDGFPQTAEYATAVIVCDRVPGTLTVDAAGAENAGLPAVRVGDRLGEVTLNDQSINQGNIDIKIKVGNVNIGVTACSGFVGEFLLKSNSGTVTAESDRAPSGVFPLLLDGSAPSPQFKETAVERREREAGNGSTYYFERLPPTTQDDYVAYDGSVVYGQICTKTDKREPKVDKVGNPVLSPETGEQLIEVTPLLNVWNDLLGPKRLLIDAEAITTGNLTLFVRQPWRLTTTSIGGTLGRRALGDEEESGMEEEGRRSC